MNSFTETHNENEEGASDPMKVSGHRDAETQENQENQLIRNPENKDNYETFDNVLADLLPDIEKEVPLEEHEVNGCMFPLARIARTIEKRTGCPVTVKRLEAIFDTWYACCESAAVFFHSDDPSDYFTYLVAIYESTKVPHNEGIMERALEAAKLEMEGPPPGINKLLKPNPDSLLIASLCYQLHLLNPEGHFFLGVRKVEELIPHLKRQKINYIIRYLCGCGFIEEIHKGSLIGRQASVFRYTGNEVSNEDGIALFDELRKTLAQTDPH
jgi:hypothetical protein